MKNRFLLAFATLFVLAASASAEKKLSEDIEATVSALEDTLKSEYEKTEQPALDLKQKYIKALTKAGDSAQKAGKLEILLEVEAEIKSVKSGTEDQNTPKDEEVLRLKTLYTKNLKNIQRKIDQKKAEADRRHAAEIDKLVTDLTKRGRIDEAKLVLSRKKPITKVSPPAEKTEEAGEAGANLAKGKPYSSNVVPWWDHDDDGGVQLTNGLTMENLSKDGVDFTVGYDAKQVEVVIDLGKSANLSRFRAFVGSVNPHGEGHKVHAPKRMSVFGSNSKEQWTRITGLDKIEDVQGWKEAKGEGNYRYVKWQFDRSLSRWIFLSELEVYGE